MARDLAASVVAVPVGGVPVTSAPSIISFNSDPTVSGAAAPLGSVGLRTDVPSFYVKTGPGKFAWTAIGFTPGSFSTLTLSGHISPPALSGTIDDYAPAGLGSAAIVRQSVVAGGATLTGLDAGPQQVNGAFIIIENLGPGVLVCAHRTGSSIGANRLSLPDDADWSIPADGSALLIYDAASSLWRVLVLGSSGRPTVVVTGAISPDPIGGAVIDYSPAGLAVSGRVRQALAGPAAMAGLAAQVDGFRVTLENIDTTHTLTLIHQDASNPTAENRFVLPNNTDAQIPPGGGAVLEYDGTPGPSGSRWRLMSGAGAPASTSLLGQIRFGGILTPPSVFQDQHSYNPAGLASAAIIRQAVTANVAVTGLKAQPSGTLIVFQNVSSSNYISFLNESPLTTTARDRFNLPDNTDWFLPPKGTLTLLYDGALERWLACSLATNRFPAQAGSGGPGIGVGPPSESVGIERLGLGQLAIQVAQGQLLVERGSISTGGTVDTTFAAANLADMQGQFRWSGVENGETVSGAVDDLPVDPRAMIRRQASGSDATITGMVGGINGRVVALVNVSGANTLTIQREGPGSVAENRFLLASPSMAIPPNGVAIFWYDGAPSTRRWRSLSTS